MTRIAYDRRAVLGCEVLVMQDPRKLIGLHALDNSLLAEGRIVEIRPRTLVLDISKSHLEEFPACWCVYPTDW